MIAAAIGALVLAVQAAAPVEPAAASPAPPAKAAKPKDDPQKVVCRSEAVVGSLIPKRVCLTQADWNALREAGKAATEDIQTRALTHPTVDQSKGP